MVENAGFGAGAAAPIARRVFDFVLAGQYPSEADIAADAARPVDGADRHAARDRIACRCPARPSTAPRRRAPASRPCRAGAAPAPAVPTPDRIASREPVALRPESPMSAVFERPTPVAARPSGLDRVRRLARRSRSLLLAAAGLLTMYSAGYDQGTRFADHVRNMALAFVVLFLAAQVPPQQLMRLAIPLYVVGVLLLVATALPGLGMTRKGATRWLNVGVTIQPSEILKIAMPLMLAWWFQRREGAAARARLRDRRRCC